MEGLRYEKLSKGKSSMSSLYVTYPDATPKARQKGQTLAKKVRQECKIMLNESIDEGMCSLRGRS